MADEEVALDLYRSMSLIRGVELRIERLHREGVMTGSFHSSMGQEAAAAGVCAALQPGDVVGSTHRGHGHAIAHGVPVGPIFAELLGRSGGVSRGKGGSMHLHDKARGFLGENAIVAGSLPWAAGAAWAGRRLGRDLIGVAFMGDGGAGQGLFYETLQLARLWSSPCLFVCENNGLAHSMPVEVAFAQPGAIAELVAAFGVESAVVDGRDPLEVHREAEALVGLVREGRPAFLEVTVVRVRPHSLNDPEYEYRDRDEGDAWLAANDPIEALRSRLEDRAAEVEAVDAEIAALIEEAVSWALDQDEPELSEALADVDAGSRRRADG